METILLLYSVDTIFTSDKFLIFKHSKRLDLNSIKKEGKKKIIFEYTDTKNISIDTLIHTNNDTKM